MNYYSSWLFPSIIIIDILGGTFSNSWVVNSTLLSTVVIFFLLLKVDNCQLSREDVDLDVDTFSNVLWTILWNS